MRTYKKLPVVIAALAVGVFASAAFAYWTAGGTGSGDAAAGTDAGVTIDAVTFSDDADADTSNSLYPGSSVDVSFDITNDSDSTPVKVGKVKADTSKGTNGVVIDATHATAGCLASWFSYVGPTLDREIAASATFSTTAGVNGGTLTMTNATSNQNACKGATVTLHLVVDNGSI